MKRTVGFFLLILSTIAAIAGAVIYPSSKFSADYGPLPLVEGLLAALSLIGVVTMILSIKIQSVWLNAVEIVLCLLAMLSLVFSFYTMMTPIAYVISGLNQFAEIQKWVYAVGCMAAAMVLHLAALFFPIVKIKK